MTFTTDIIANSYQSGIKKVLCVCTAGLLRSPTAAEILSRFPYHYNTRSTGIDSVFAIMPLTLRAIYWADEIVCMEQYHRQMIYDMFGHELDDFEKSKWIVLGIPDKYRFRDPQLKKLIRSRYNIITGFDK